MRFLSILVMICCLTLLSNCSSSVDETSNNVYSKPIINYPYLDTTFIVEEEPVPVDSSIVSMGKTIVRRKSDGALFTTWVIPYKKIDKGTEVQLIQIKYRHNDWQIPAMFTIIK